MARVVALVAMLVALGMLAGCEEETCADCVRRCAPLRVTVCEVHHGAPIWVHCECAVGAEEVAVDGGTPPTTSSR